MRKEIKELATPATYQAKPKGDGEASAAKSRAPEVIKTLREALPVPLTNQERIDFGQELARAEGEIDQHETQSALVKADLKAKEAEIRARISSLSTALRNGTKLADVEVQIVADFETNTAVYVRLDYGKEVRRRALDPSERQGLLPIDDDGDDGEAPKPPSDVDTNDEDTSEA